MTTVLPWEEVPKVFNVIFGRVMKALKLVEIGRNKYDSQAAVKIPQHKLEVYLVGGDVEPLITRSSEVKRTYLPHRMFS